MYLYRLLSIIGRGLLTASINFLTFLADRQTGKEGAKDLRNLSGKEVLYCITRPVYIEEVRVNMCEQGVYNICDICVRRMTVISFTTKYFQVSILQPSLLLGSNILKGTFPCYLNIDLLVAT